VLLKPSVAVVGSLNADLTLLVDHLPGPGETVLSIAPRQLAFGGKGGNQAAVAFGAEVTMIGRVGDDESGRRLHADLAARGIDVSQVLVTRAGAAAPPRSRQSHHRRSGCEQSASSRRRPWRHCRPGFGSPGPTGDPAASCYRRHPRRPRSASTEPCTDGPDPARAAWPGRCHRAQRVGTGAADRSRTADNAGGHRTAGRQAGSRDRCRCHAGRRRGCRRLPLWRAGYARRRALRRRGRRLVPDLRLTARCGVRLPAVSGAREGLGA
jgi:pfkB family carbohydrate kinase